MRSRRIIVATFAVAAIIVAPAAGQSASQSKSAIQTAYTEFRSGLRHSDGKLACSRMTLSYRNRLLKLIADGGVAGLGCVALIDGNGRDIYNQVKNQANRLARITLVTNTRARAKTNTGGTACFRRDKGRWKLHSGGMIGRLCRL